MDEVLNLCIAARHDQKFAELREDCKILSRYKTYFTYPGPIPEVISVEEARAANEKARRIKNFVMKKAEELGYYQDWKIPLPNFLSN